jgi:hypothetical protein
MVSVVKNSKINVRQTHQDAWANFYTDVWRREFGTRFGVMPGILVVTLQQNLKPYGGTLTETDSGEYLITFTQEQDYTWFELRWAGENAVAG